MLQRGRGRGMSQSDDSSRPGGGRGRLASSSGMYKCIILQRRYCAAGEILHLTESNFCFVVLLTF